MTQLFIGVKPNVGPVVKVLKYDTDDPLTLPNEAYGRYYFNSETQKLAYLRDIKNFPLNWWTEPGTGGNDYQSFFGTGNADTATYSGFVYKNDSDSFQSARHTMYARHKTMFKDVPYVPLSRVRHRGADGWTLAARRDISWIYDAPNGSTEIAVYFSYQDFGTWFKNSEWSGNGDWNHTDRIFPSGVQYGDWIMAGGSGCDVQQGNWPTKSISVSKDNQFNEVIHGHYDLPGDASPMTTYTPVEGLEALRLNSDGIVFARPGYSVDSSAGTRHRILDNDTTMATVVMSGVTGAIAPGQTLEVPSKFALDMDAESIVELMIRNENEEQYVPAHIRKGYARSNRVEVKYKVNPRSLSIWNNGTHNIIVTYFVFHTNLGTPSTGGNQVLFKQPAIGDDTGYIQIKRPGTSDPASRLKDIILDTRLPQLQIIKEGFIPRSQFTDDPEDTATLGRVAKQIDFENNGFTPFVKFTLVFEDRILPPIATVYYDYPYLSTGNKFSSLARVHNDNVKFWMNPDSWCSRYRYNSGQGSIEIRERWYAGQPLGIRYYIFGVTT